MIERSATGFIRTVLKFDRERTSGTLDVRAEGLRTSIYFRRGEVVFADGGTLGETLGRLLVDDEILTDAQYAKAIQVMTDSLVDNEQMRLGEVLVTLGFLGLEDVQVALSLQVRRKIMRCLQWDKMQLSFDPSAERLCSIGSFPTAVEPLIIEGVRRFYDRGRMDEVMGPYLPHYARLRDQASLVCGRFRLERDDVVLVRAIDGTQRLNDLVVGATERGVDARPLLTGLLLANAIEPLAQPASQPHVAAGAPKPPAPAVQGSSRPAGPPRQAAVSARGPRPAAVETDRSAAAAHGTERPAEERSSSSRAGVGGAAPTARRRPRRGRDTGRPEVPPQVGAERPSGTPRRSLFRPKGGGSAGRRSVWRDDEPSRRQRPTWRDLREEPRRLRGTHRALGDWREGASEEERQAEASAMSTLPPARSAPAPGAEAEEVLDTAAQARKARVEAEQAFCRGMRYLYGERLAEAEEWLSRAAAAVPDAGEYQLCAAWARYRRGDEAADLPAVRRSLDKLARAAAFQDRALAFPPYVLAHLALAEGDEPRALKLFQVAAYRESANKDAERHVRLLSRRLGRKG